MKRILFHILLLVPMLSYTSDIEHDMSYKQMNIRYDTYLIKGAGENCEITVGNKDWIDSTTCLSLTNSKGIKILCTKKKKMCKTESEFLDFVNPLETENSPGNHNNVLRVLERWTNAHNTQDMNKLKNLYANEITYYGKKLSLTKCIKDKKRALAKYPQFRIRIDNIEYLSVTPTITKITFDKYVSLSPRKQEKMYPSYLLVDLLSNSILVESDTVTDKNLKKNKTADVVIKDSSVEAPKDKIYRSNKVGVNGMKDNCDHGDGRECLLLAMAYSEGGLNLNQDEDKAIYYMKKSCHFNLKEACQILDYLGYSY